METDALELRVVDHLDGDELGAVGHHVELGAHGFVLGEDLGHGLAFAAPGLVLENLVGGIQHVEFRCALCISIEVGRGHMQL